MGARRRSRVVAIFVVLLFLSLAAAAAPRGARPGPAKARPSLRAKTTKPKTPGATTQAAKSAPKTAAKATGSWVHNPRLRYIALEPLGADDAHFPLAAVQAWESRLEGVSVAPADECALARAVTDDSLPLVALASFPRSGNTLLRYLLEKATGLRSGSIHHDPNLKSRGLAAEGEVHGVLVVKSHEPHLGGSVQLGLFAERVVFAARDPFDAVRAKALRDSVLE